ncbi:MAG TPA: urease accessory protein, partial [Gammaproteobacteria bacterium]|nr:urease accessory protein [Gammaproteobacteria bacterium]
KFYRSNGDTARQTQRLRVDAGATLEWLPQDNIVFPGAVVASDTRIELHASARFIGWEVHCLGRPANHERFDQGQFRAQLQLLRDGQPLLWERLQVAAEPDLDALAGLRGHPVNATLVATGADASLLEAIQSNWSAIDSGGIGHTLLDDILVSRLLCHSTEQTHRVLTAIWAWLRPRLLGRKACHPRIWST